MLDTPLTLTRSFLLVLLGQILPLWLLQANQASAQIIPDSTLTNPSIVPANCTNCNITGGSTSGNNLFHSFETFSVPTGGEAFFDNVLTIENIFSRITGNSPSNIDGVIRANGFADLFLINPNGIVFGEEASLDLGGSFIGTTAQTILFEDGSQFIASDSQVNPLLTINLPIGLQFDQATPAPIVNRSNASPGNAINALGAVLGAGPIAPVGLQVNPEQTLALVGGNVMLEGGNLTAPGGRVEIGSLGSNSTVTVTPDSLGWALGYENVDNFSDITLSGFALIDTSDFQGLVDGTSGPIILTGRNISLQEASQAFTINFGPQAGSPINVTATDSVTIDGFDANVGQVSSIYTLTFGPAAAADINLAANNLTISQVASLGTATIGPAGGDTGSVNVLATGLVEVLDSNGIFVQVTPGATGNGADLNLQASQLVVENGSQISTSTFGIGNAGDLSIIVSDLISLSGSTSDGVFPSNISSAVNPGSSGNSGSIIIETRQLNVTDGAQIANRVLGGGQGSDIQITATDSILLSGTTPNATILLGSSGIFVAADPAAVDPTTNVLVPTTGSSGDLTLTTPTLTVESGARISADTFGTGPGGELTLNVAKLFVLEGGQIRAGSLVEEGAASTERGPGGTLTVNASDLVEISGAGNIGSTPVSSALIVSAEGSGRAGNIFLTGPNELRVTDGDIRTDAAQSAGGTIIINAGAILLSGDGDIRTNVASGANNGGDILIEADSLVALDDSDILAFAADGAGGDITLPPFFGQNFEPAAPGTDPDTLDGNNQVDVNATGQLASGTITFPDVSFIENSLSELPDAPIDTETLVASSCIAPVAQGSGRLVVTGADGIPQQPGSAGVAEIPTGSVRTLPEATAAAPDTPEGWEIGDPISEPQAVYQLVDGRMVLSRECS
ncbi:MAG: filamentous hemagglutinin N-terminal domain-containing protein [Cyanobacteria bacterium J06635_15]